MIRKLLHTVEAAIQPFESIKKDVRPFEWIANSAPCFPVMGHNIQILRTPDQFYNFLLMCSKEANKRVTLASLYLGIGNLEEKFVSSLAKNPSFLSKKLKVNILLDHSRASRTNKANMNSRTMLLPLLEANDETCEVSLYHTPDLRGLLKKCLFSPLNELIGLQHMKVYVFDDILIISGANFSNDYFDKRQDRYVVIKDEKLSDFYCGLVKTVQKFSLRMDKNNCLSLKTGWDVHPYRGDRNKFIERAKVEIESYITKARERYTDDPGFDTCIYPLIQMGQLGIDQDEKITTRILAETEPNSSLKFASGYFNLTQQYKNTLVNEAKAQCDILMAHPEANGFLVANGIASNIPYAYSLLACNFKNKLLSSQQELRIRLFEYLRPSWTYHAKGLWYYPPGAEYPCMTVIGSSNFGERSAKRDLETQIIIVTENSNLQCDLHEEWSALYEFAIPAETERPVSKWIHIILPLFRSFF